MPSITLVKHDMPDFTEEEKAVIRRFLFGFVDGLGELNRRMWRRLWHMILNRLEVGEVMTVTTHKARSLPFHNRSMKLINEFFDTQEKFDSQEVFLSWLKIGAGWVNLVPGPDGALCALPRSISFSEAEDGEFREFFTAALVFMRTEHFSGFLWPHLTPDAREEMVEVILERFNE